MLLHGLGSMRFRRCLVYARFPLRGSHGCFIQILVLPHFLSRRWALGNTLSSFPDAISVFEIQISISSGDRSVSSTVPINSSLIEGKHGYRIAVTPWDCAQGLSMSFSASVFTVSICDVCGFVYATTMMFWDILGRLYVLHYSFDFWHSGMANSGTHVLTGAWTVIRVFPDREISNLAVDRVTAPVSQDDDMRFYCLGEDNSRRCRDDASITGVVPEEAILRDSEGFLKW